jgi:hypothetical protein
MSSAGSKAGRFMEGLYVVGGITTDFKDKYQFVLNIMFCMPVMLICYHVFCCAYELLLISLMMYISSNHVLTLYCLEQSVN